MEGYEQKSKAEQSRMNRATPKRKRKLTHSDSGSGRHADLPRYSLASKMRMIVEATDSSLVLDRDGGQDTRKKVPQGHAL